ncbi:hypothetical protein MKW92_046432 [Papaver armeniacum]|nr:hypothetical protein MKW92_046432 [Papaver armeniacum]
MHKTVGQTLRKVGGSSLYSCRQFSPAPYPIPKSNPTLSLPHSSSSSALFNGFSKGVFYTSVEVPRNYFYCDTEDFKEMLNDFKKDNKKMYPYVMEAMVARVTEHWKDDEKLMEELGVREKTFSGLWHRMEKSQISYGGYKARACGFLSS